MLEPLPLRFSRKNNKAPWAIFFFLTVVLFFSSQNLPFLMKSSEDTTISTEEVRRWSSKRVKTKSLAEGVRSRQLALLVLGGFAIVSILVGNRSRLRIRGLLGHLIIFYLIWATLSLTWAEDVSIAFRRLVVLWMLWLGALAVAKRFSMRDIILFAFFNGILVLLMGICIEIVRGEFHPLYSLDSYWFIGGMRAGTQAHASSTLLFASIALAQTAKRRSWPYFIAAGAALFFLFLGRSRTYFWGALLAAIFFWILVSPKPRRLFFYAICIVCVTCITWLLIGETFLTRGRELALLGRDFSYILSLSSRDVIWKDCVQLLIERPFLGYGYACVTADSPLMLKIGKSVGWAAGHPHNGYLELALGLGIIGGGVYVLILLTGLKVSFSSYKESGDVGYAFALTMLLYYCLLMGFSGISYSAGIIAFVTLTLLAKLGFGRIPAVRKGGTLVGH